MLKKVTYPEKGKLLPSKVGRHCVKAVLRLPGEYLH